MLTPSEKNSMNWLLTKALCLNTLSGMAAEVLVFATELATLEVVVPSRKLAVIVPAPPIVAFVEAQAVQANLIEETSDVQDTNWNPGSDVADITTDDPL